MPARSRTRSTTSGGVWKPFAARLAYAFTSSMGSTSPVPSASVRLRGSSDAIPIRFEKPMTASTPSASTSFTETVFLEWASAAASSMGPSNWSFSKLRGFHSLPVHGSR
ncbi:hypothetical protein PSR1_04010 [Anaeromyxobacter sp. PSR-1]|nr:hypothetical protein PSR1_04010 [Anaeromyxobacter sp. PSR-1]